MKSCVRFFFPSEFVRLDSLPRGGRNTVHQSIEILISPPDAKMQIRIFTHDIDVYQMPRVKKREKEKHEL